MITIRKLSDSQAEEIQIELKQDFPWKEYPQAKGNYPLALCLKSDDVAEEKRGIRLDFPSETAFRMFRDLLYPLYSIYIFNYGCHGPFWRSHEIYPGVPFDYKYLIPKKNPKAVEIIVKYSPGFATDPQMKLVQGLKLSNLGGSPPRMRGKE